MLTLSLLLAFVLFTRTHASLECTACTAVFDALEKFGNSTIPEILRDFDKACSILPAGTIRHDCDTIAAKAASVTPAFIHFLEGRDLDGYHLCSWLEIACPVECCVNRHLPEQVRLGFAGPGMVSVTWITATSAPLPQFLFTSSANVTATTTTYTSGLWVGRIHRAVVRATPGSTFTYGVGTYDNFVQDFTATVPLAEPSATVVGAAIADMGASKVSDLTVAALSDAAKNTSAGLQFVLHTGDIAYADGVQSIWDEYGRKAQPFTSTLPILTCPGNHEIIYNFTAYKARYASTTSLVPGNDGAMYSINVIGPMVVVGVSTESPLNTPEVSTEQIEWLHTALAAAKRWVDPNRGAVESAIASRRKALGRPLTRGEAEEVAAAAVDGPTWIVVMGHRPLYCSGVGGGFPEPDSDCTSDAGYLQQQLEPLFARYGVDVVIAGHRHNSERSYPICYDGGHHSVVRENSPNGPWKRNPGCPVYIVSGAAGNREGLEKRFSDAPPVWCVPSSRLLQFSYGIVRISPFSFEHSLYESASRSVIDGVTLTATDL